MREPSPDHAALEVEIRTFQPGYRVISDAMEKLKVQRGALVQRARALDPPMTYKALAALFEVTQAAIQQQEYRMINKAQGT